MTAVACTLVSLCVCLILVSGLPAAKRLPLSHESDDVLAGSDFLSVFMQRNDRLRTADRLDGPFEPHQYDRDLNSVSHKAALMDLVKPYTQLADKYTLSNIFKTTKYGYSANDMPGEVEEYQITTPDVIPTIDTDVKTTTQFTEPTTIEDIPTTTDTYDKIASNITSEEQLTTVMPNLNFDTKLESTTHKFETEKVEEKVISVRVSSSVARHSHRTVDTSTAKSTPEVVSKTKQVDENLVSTLVTQDQPTITAVQRSEFAVEEASLPGSLEGSRREPKEQNPYERQDEVEGKVEEVSLYSNEHQSSANGKLPVFEIHFHNPPAALISNYGDKPDVQRNDDRIPSYRRKEFRQLSPYERQPEPISYHSRISSPTSDSNVNFYREHHRSNAAAETVHQPVLAEPYPPSPYQRAKDKTDEDNSGDSKYKENTSYQDEPRERTYGEPEKVYGQPEVNYEVDEAVSVITNGKAHGAQVPTPLPSQNPEDPSGQNKFGYVVEGRNFRKYRVEERTADGFIVGEYGVVSHDDGSLRGVRYTADSTINPRLIYDTLVKFLSLK